MVGIRVRFSRHDCVERPVRRRGAERVEQNDDALHRDWTLFLIRRAFDLRANHWIRCKRGVRVRGGGEGVVEEVFDVAAASLDEAKLDENERRRRGEDDDEDYYAARRRRRSKHPLRRLLPNLPPSISHDVPRRVGRPVSNRHHRVSRGLRSSRRHDRRRVRPRGVHVRRRPRRQTNGRGNQRENGWVVRGSFIRSLWCPRVDSRGIIILLYMSCMYSILLLYYCLNFASIFSPPHSYSFFKYFLSNFLKHMMECVARAR